MLANCERHQFCNTFDSRILQKDTTKIGSTKRGYEILMSTIILPVYWFTGQAQFDMNDFDH